MFLLTSAVVSPSLAISSPKIIKHSGDHQEIEVTSKEPLFNTRNIIQNIFQKNNDGDPVNIFTGVLHTTCDSVEKTTEITFGIYNEIDVDDDENTGVNGKDIRVQYLILPWIYFDPDFMFGVLFTVSVERIGEEIKDKNFNATVHLNDDKLILGYGSPAQTGSEIPESIRISSLIFFKPSDETHGLKFYVDPVYSSPENDNILTFFASYEEDTMKRMYSFSFNPAVETQITISSTKNPEVWEYLFTRDTPQETTVTAQFVKIVNGEKKETQVTIDPLPDMFSFTFALTPFTEGGGSFLYQSATMYDIKLLITSDDLGICKYALIQDLPRMVYAEWIPTKNNGYYHLIVDSDGTNIILRDSLDNTTVNLTVNDLKSINITAHWNLTNPGNFTVKKDPSLHIDLDVIIGEWEAKLDAEPVAEDISVEWYTNVTGFLAYDTNWQPLNEIDLLIKGSELGIRTLAETFKAEDFRLNWTIWPPVEWNIKTSGKIDFISIVIEIYIDGEWYHLWPW